MTCDLCVDENGDECFPSYGPAPHKCFYKITGAVIGESQPILREEWPDGFTEFTDDPGMGVYWCQHCGSGKPGVAEVTEESSVTLIPCGSEHQGKEGHAMNRRPCRCGPDGCADSSCPARKP